MPDFNNGEVTRTVQYIYPGSFCGSGAVLRAQLAKQHRYHKMNLLEGGQYFENKPRKDGGNSIFVTSGADLYRGSFLYPITATY